MDYFGLDEEIPPLERALVSELGESRARLAVHLAWYLRRRDTRRAVRLVKEAAALLEAEQPGRAGEQDALRARMLLVEGECQWLFGNLAAAQETLERAQAGFHAAADRCGTGDGALALALLHHERGNPKQCGEALDQALHFFEAAGDETRLCLTQARLANFESYQNQDRAKQRWGALLRDASQHPHPGVRGAAQVALGTQAFDTNAVEAMQHYQLAHEFLLLAGDLHGACMQASNVGSGLHNMHIHDIALEWMERAYEIAQPTGWERTLGWCKIQIGLVLTEVGRYAFARTFLHEGRAALAAYPSRTYAHACWYLGQLCLLTKEHDEALELMAQTERLGRQLGNTDMVLHSIRGQAEALSLAARAAEAKAMVERGLAQAREIDCAWQETLSLEALAKIHRTHSPALPEADTPRAVIDYLEQALAAAARTNGYSVKPEVYADLSREYEALGDWQRALAHERQATQAREASHAKRTSELALVTQWRRERRQAQTRPGHSDTQAATEPPGTPAHTPVPAPPQDQDDIHKKARAFAMAARADLSDSRMHLARDNGHRAARLFHQMGDVAGEASALATVSLACGSLGRHEEAIEAALLCTGLAESMPFGTYQVLAADHLGMACTWAWRFDEAASAFHLAIRHASGCSPPASASSPRVHLAVSEALRVMLIRSTSGETPSLDRLQASLHALATPEEEATRDPAERPGRAVARATRHIAWGLLHCWKGSVYAAQAEHDAAVRQLGSAGARSTAALLLPWLRAELSLARGDLAAANLLLQALVPTALQLEHEQMAMLARLFASKLLERQGQHGAALQQLQRMLIGQQQTRAEALDDRQEVVQWQLQMRNHKALAESEARRAETLEAANDTLRTLGTIGNEITATLDPAAVFEALHRHAGQLMDTTSLSIYLLEGQQLALRFGVEEGRRLPAETIALDDPGAYAARSVRERRMLLPDRSATLAAPQGEASRLMPSAMFAPLASGDRMLGALAVQSWREGAYRERERLIFRTLAAYGSVAIANVLGAQELAAAQAELERQRMRNMLVHAGKLVSMGQLASGIVHELSHPVGAIALSLDSLQALWRSGQPHSAMSLLPELEHEVHRLRTLIQRLRHLARSDPPRITAVPLRAAIDDARKMFGPRMASAGVRCEESVDDLCVQADAELLSLAIANLVVNAIDAMAGIETKLITLRGLKDDDAHWVCLTIADTGPGLPPLVLENLFKPFITTKPADQGLGLGLTLCLEYLSAMGAQIQGRNGAKGGAEFQLTLASAR